MNFTVELEGENKFSKDLGISEEERKMLEQFIEPGANQFFYKKSNISYVSRKQAVQFSIESLLKEIVITQPNTFFY